MTLEPSAEAERFEESHERMKYLKPGFEAGNYIGALEAIRDGKPKKIHYLEDAVKELSQCIKIFSGPSDQIYAMHYNNQHKLHAFFTVIPCIYPQQNSSEIVEKLNHVKSAVEDAILDKKDNIETAIHYFTSLSRECRNRTGREHKEPVNKDLVR